MIQKQYDIEYSLEVETNNPLWAKPYAKGKIKVLFFPSVLYGIEVVELIKRMDYEFETITVDRMWDLNKWGLGDFYDIRGHQWDSSIMYNNMEAAVTSEEHFDVLVVPVINGWGFFTPKTKEAILRRVEAGAGLVLIRPLHGKDLPKSAELETLSPLIPTVEEVINHKNYPLTAFDQIRKDRWEKATPHYITSGIPIELFPFEDLGYYEYGLDPAAETILRSESGLPIASVKQVGRGRVVAFGYHPKDVTPNHNGFATSSCFDSNMEKWKGGQSGATFKFQEYAYGLIGKSIIWAADKEPDTRIAGFELNGDTLQVLIDGGVQSGCTLSCRLLNAHDEVVAELEAGEELRLELPSALHLGGQFRADVRLQRDGLVLDWATYVIEHPLVSQISAFQVDQELINAGEQITGKVDVPAGRGELVLTLIDFFDYVHHVHKVPIDGDASVSFELPVYANSSLYMYVHADIRVDGFLIDRRTVRVFVPAENRLLDDYEMFLVASNRGLGEFDKLTGKRFRELGVTGLFPGSNRLSVESGVKGMGVYWYNRKPYADRKEQYFQTMDKKYLHRVPCFNDPSFWEGLREEVRHDVSRNKPFRPLSYFANDEGSVTAYIDELDLCFCPYCMSDMREWLKSGYADLDELNQVWNTAFASWEEVEPYTFEEARKTGDYASWGDHRLFMEKSFAGSYERITAMIREIDPEGVTRLSGCQASTTYSGYDYYQLHKHVGYVESYSVGHQYEMHRSFAQPETAIGGWFGYGNKGVSARHFVWNGLFHGLTMYSLFHDHSILNPDFTFSQSARDIGIIAREIRREGIGKLLLYGSTRDHLGIALHYSMSSVHGSYMKGEHLRFERNRAGWMQLLEDLGYQYQLLASPQIEDGALLGQGYKLLILPYSIAISDREAEEIRKFVEAGGVIIGDFQTGIMDQHCREYDSGKLDALFGIKRTTTYMMRFYCDESCFANADFPYFKHVPGYKTKGQIANGFGVPVAEKGTRADTGVAAFVDDLNRYIPLVTVNEAGQGKGIYLNLGFDKYSEIRLDPIGHELRELLRKSIGLSEARKYAELKTAEGETLDCGYESFYYKGVGGSKYFGILRNAVQMKTGADGVALGGADGVSAIKPQALRLELQEKAHLYNMREGSYIGYTDVCRTELAQGDTLLLTALPCKVEAVEVGLDSVQRRGEPIELRIQVLTDRLIPDWSSTCSVTFYDPSGEYHWMYSHNVNVSGATTAKTLRVPLNERAGTWRVEVKDVASGTRTSLHFDLV
ncbi:beta-galactosidase [Paenibacillus koleovorans]|uniref:beta-galactosidase n=1 Tax=Paenibacillus koleovorans TaxID=121608 RepID=UPI0013E2C74A|nr:beta-galactosidase [Paenibacillus koleovorans]